VNAREAALAFARETTTRCADRAEEWEHGVLLRAPSLGDVWAINAAIAVGPPPDMEFSVVDALLDREFPGRWSSAFFEEGAAADRIEAGARERGWRIEHELYMALRRDPDRVSDTSAVREVEPAEARGLMERWNEEELTDHDAEALRQVADFSDREWASRPTRVLVTDDGLATTRVFAEDGIAQVEAVYTAPEARGRGYARALLTRAIAIAREGDPDLVFIVADDDDTPKQLYGRLGFDPVVRITRVVRERK
jgi:ribosomal protein S18 acetylase RimI-like enzyme